MKVDLKLMQTLAKHIASKEETRFYLRGVYVHSSSDGSFMAATDGHKLVLVRLPDGKERFSVIVPSAWLLNLKLPRDAGLADLTAIGLDISISHNGLGYTLKAIDGTFPDIKRVAPRNFDINHATFKGADIVALEAVAVALDSAISIVPNGPFNPALVKFIQAKKEREDVYGVVMAMKDLGGTTSVPF